MPIKNENTSVKIIDEIVAYITEANNTSVTTYKIHKNHFTINNSQPIQEISADLFLKFGINGFRHIRLYKDGARFELTTDPYWFEHYMEQGYFNHNPTDLYSNIYQSGYILLDACNKPKSSNTMLFDAVENYNGGGGFSIFRRSETWIDRFDFSAPINNITINQTLLSNIDYLDNFVNQYLARMVSLVNKAHKAREFLPFSSKLFQECQDIFLPQHILKALNYQKGRISNLSESILTKRELECLYWLHQGKTAPDIAIILNISNRTVEKFIASLKEKFNCRTLFQVGELMIRLQLDRLLQIFKF